MPSDKPYEVPDLLHEELFLQDLSHQLQSTWIKIDQLNHEKVNSVPQALQAHLAFNSYNVLDYTAKYQCKNLAWNNEL